MLSSKEIIILTPFEMPDVRLVLETIKAGAYPILHLGRNRIEAQNALNKLSDSTSESFGVCFVEETPTTLSLPSNVSRIIFPFGMKVKVNDTIEKLCQVHSLDEAKKAVKNGIKNLIVKGNEGAGKVGDETSFILFQNLMKNISEDDINVFIQGGMGIHTSAAALALGAKGIIMDSQVVLFNECSAPEEIKEICKRLSGNETTLIENYRVLIRNNSPLQASESQYSKLSPYLGGFDLSSNMLPVGQDISLSVDYYEKYQKLKIFVSALREAAYGHLLQAKKQHIIREGNKLAKDLDIKYPIAQGPMARVSDVPEFISNVADNGALPFLALSMAKGTAARELVNGTKSLLQNKAWGIGILGFIPSEIREEQTKYILEAKPSVVLIAGGRPSLAKPFENAGIKVFLHVPSSALLDIFLKEGAKNFIFEGRESGGHIGPVSSTILWEKQIYRLLQEDNLSSISIFFAGGIHDAFSSAFISVMSSTLAARGAKIGVLMGSSYIYTKEAVESGAISPEFQTQALKKCETVVLEAAPGQETRSLKCGYTDFFLEEKKRLQSELGNSKEVWIKLEDINLGRLRIAAKGVERVNDKLIKLAKKDQIEKGLFMMGQIASMHNEIMTLEELHSHVAIDNNKLLSEIPDLPLPKMNSNPLDIAIVGVSCIFPDAHNIEEYWRNIVLGKDCITEVPDSRWNKDLYYSPDSRDTDYVVSKWGGFIPTVDFDPLEFGMTPQSLASIEPTQLLSLLVAKQALTDAGYKDLSKIDLENTSVIFGAEGSTELAGSYGFRGYMKQVFGELPDDFKNSFPKLNEDSFAGVLSNVISGRIANRLNLGGRNYTVDAACASSLAALDLGCQELHTNRSDMVLLGGADLHNGINDFLMFSCTHALSHKGYSASFDAESDGIALGEGIGVLVLKRLEDAERDGNKIYAVIKGVGGSSDGKSLGLTAPNKKGQIKALQRAYQTAGILPSQVGMIEAHGTGTVVGDRTELSALTDMFLESGAVQGQAALGSVKTQIGHAKCAAGIAGIIKTAMSIYYGIHPPTLHLNKPNPYYDKENSPFVFNKQAGIWNDEKRIAGVSAFGFGGTNFHVVMENYKNSPSYSSAMPLWASELFVFRGESLSEAKLLLQNIKKLLNYNDNISIKDIAYTLAAYNDKNIQISIIASGHKELINKIDAALADKNESGIYYRNEKDGKVAFMFSGQGSQRVNMARDLFVAFPSMRYLLSGYKDYENILFPVTAFDEETRKQQQKMITDTRNAQPLLGVVDLAIAELLKSIGLIPDMVAGHSYGEIPALCFAGGFDSSRLIELSRERALSILNAVGDDKGKMIAVNIPEEDLNILLEGEKEVWAVNFNSYKQIVIAGSSKGISSFTEKLAKNNVAYKELNVACAFHSPLLKKSKELYAKVLKNIEFHDLSVPVWSNTTGKQYPVRSEEIKKRLSEHLVKPVLFTRQLENMYEEEARIFIETGPGNVLTGLVNSTLGDKVLTLDTENKNQNGVSYILHTIAKYISTGKSIDFIKLYEDRNASLVDIDNPEQYKKKDTLWYVNGHNAEPYNRKMPSNGAYPVTKPLINLKDRGNKVDGTPETHSDQLVMEYLHNMRTMIQNQRDVMLGYLGYVPPAQETIPVSPIQMQQIATTNHAQSFIEEQSITSSLDSTSHAVISLEDVKNLLLDIVSEKTGYPVDMLGLDLDIESDLSIDSIKRMEIIGTLREKLNIDGNMEDAEDVIEKMAAIKTLNGMIEWISELMESHKGESIPAYSETVSMNGSPDSVPTLISSAQIKALLLETVSEKTGYPVDMLGLDLDIESDLSIDSIKRMEIIGTLREKLNIDGNLEDAEDAIEKMAAIKTLNGMIAWMEELADVHQGNSSSEKGKPVQETISIKKEEDLIRMCFELEERTLSTVEKLPIKDRHFALTDDGGNYATAIKDLLEKNGIAVDLIKGDENLNSYDGLIVLNASSSPKKYSIQETFTMIKNTDLSKIKWIYTISDILGKIGDEENIKELKEIQGFPGLIKSLHHEFPEINFRAIVSYSIFDSNTLPRILLDELLIQEPIHIEIVYKNNKRCFLNPKPSILPVGAKSNLDLNEDSIIVVFGGAQGITPELISELSKEYPCQYILVGRSEKPSHEFEKYMDLDTKDKIRKYLITEEKMNSPAQIEKKVQKIFKANQININIEKIQQAGGQVTYVSLDIKDEEALRNFIRDIYETFGRIDGVFHAAGLLDDKLFINKTFDSFQQVYSTKVIPLHILLEELKPDLKLFVMFSSVASSYGNKGQTDYASANSVFDLVASNLSNKIDARVLAINWGPWKGTGMVDETLEAEFKKRGVSLISLKAGAEYFVNELKYGNEANVLVMGGAEDVKNALKLA